MAPNRSALLLLLASIFLLFALSQLGQCTASATKSVPEEEEDLDALDEPVPAHHEEESSYEEYDEGEGDENSVWDDDAYGIAVNDSDVVVLSKSNFTDFVKSNRYVLVEFYAPWCGHCQALAPEYAGAATKLKGEIVLAKVDATLEDDLAQEYEVSGYPTLLFFVDGVHRPYGGQRTEEDIIKWTKKKIGPAVTNILSIEDAKTALETDGPVSVAFLDKLDGTEAEEYASAARQDDEVTFYQTSKSEVAELFNLKGKKSPALVLLKNEPETVSYFDGKFERGEITNFIFANKFPLVMVFSKENSTRIFGSSVTKQLILFAGHEEFNNVYPTYHEAAKSLKGKVMFVYVNTSEEDTASQILEFFGITAEKPMLMAFSAEESGKKHLFEDDITSDNIKVFGEEFLAGKLAPYFKSAPIPEQNGDVKIVVGKNFDEIVLDESKDVLLEIYAPWCGHCQALEPIYEKLAKHLRDVPSLVIAKMDGTANEHARAKSDGFPTILFFPAGSKSFDPITVDTDRTVKAFYQFLKKNAAIPFTLPKTGKTEKKVAGDTHKETADKIVEETTKEARDEL